MPDLSPELMDVVAMLRERVSDWTLRAAELEAREGYRCETQAICEEKALECLDIVGVIKNGMHIGAHERARKGGG